MILAAGWRLWKMESRVQHVLALLLVVAIVPSVRCQDTCGELGNGEGSECTEDFASPYHIDILVGNTIANLVTASGQQVLIPNINFTCNGNITKWIVGADWNKKPKAQSTTYTELQVWRESSVSSSFNSVYNTYTKVGSTIIVIDSKDNSGLYEYPLEYPLETPLAFQEGDVLGYYQPYASNKQNIDLYLEEPNSLVAFFCGADRNSSVDTSSSKCNINNNKYPLIKVETNPPNSGRGFMSLERMITLLTLTLTTRNVMEFSGQQLIFPSVRFNCSGEVAKWIMVGTEWFGDSKPELQIWTPLENNMFTKTSGSIISSAMMIRSRVYEYEVESPLPFQPGDILGVFQPLFTDSQLQVNYDSDDDSLYYFISTGADVYPQNTTFNTTDGALTLTGLPLVSVEIKNILPTTTTSEPTPPTASIFASSSSNKEMRSSDRASATVTISQLLSTRPPADIISLTVRMLTQPSTADRDSSILSPSTNDGGITTVMLSSTKDDASTVMLSSTKEGASTVMLSSTKDDASTVMLSSTKDDASTVMLSSTKDDASTVMLSSTKDDASTVMLSSTKENGIPTTTVMLPSTNDDGIPTTMVSLPTPTTTVMLPSTDDNGIPTTMVSLPTPTTTVMLPSTDDNGIPTTTVSLPTPTTTVMLPSTDDNGIPTTMVSLPTPTTTVMLPSTDYNGIPTTTVSLPTPTITVMLPSTDDSRRSTIAIVGIVVSLLLVLLLLAVTSVVTFFCVHKAHKKNNTAVGSKKCSVSNPTYGLFDTQLTVESSRSEHYEMVDNIKTSPGVYTDDLYAIPDMPAHYEVPVRGDSQRLLGSATEWGIYVPSKAQRQQHQEIDHVYEAVKTMVRESGDNIFFKKSDTFWRPAANPAALYDQLSRYRFREIQRHLIRTGDALGSGQSGEVIKGVWQCPRGKVEVAVKILRSGASDQDRVKFLQEAAIMGQFLYPNVIRLHGVVTLGEPVMIAMELMKDGDLEQYLQKLKPIPGEMPAEGLPQQLLDFCHQISAGMRYLSDLAFVHRDLAARNILVSGRTCKIADFGMARDLEENDYYTSHGGRIPVKWTAPEALHYKKYSTASDVWGFGCLMYEIWSLGHKPFDNFTNAEALRRVVTGWRLPPPPGCPREIYHLMIKCWHPEASDRPEFADVLQSLSRPEQDLLSTGEVRVQPPLLGSPLETGQHLYPHLQNTYCH